jgi:hypothetical protein
MKIQLSRLGKAALEHRPGRQHGVSEHVAEAVDEAV